ncbi:hypothetical protein AVEN_219830-1 [Araneus ventricosus]|uniref:DUF4817 domain-containing protein n=1 Tax=Araneus ventricosus TaxID=182803 RepID=A0A4Y2JV03_ARAVE|nr:hypothetical protein AVEN_219830-1 [Araneus ventricosus]
MCYENDGDIANAFAAYFSSVFKPSTELDGDDEYKSNCVDDLVKIDSVTYDDVILAIRRDVLCFLFFRKITNGSIDCSNILSFINFAVPARSLRNYSSFQEVALQVFENCREIGSVISSFGILPRNLFVSACERVQLLKMVLFLEHRIFIVLEYHRMEHSYVQTRRSFQRRFDVRRGSSDNAIKALFEKFERTGNVNDNRIGNVGRPRSAITESNADAI